MSPKATERGAEVANPKGLTEGLSFSEDYNPPVSFAASPLYTRGPFLHKNTQKSTYFFKKHKKVSNKGSKAGGEDSVSG